MINPDKMHLKKFSASAGIFVPSPVPEGLQQFWRKLVVNMLRMQPKQKPSRKFFPSNEGPAAAPPPPQQPQSLFDALFR